MKPIHLTKSQYDDHVTLQSLSSTSTVSENLNGGQIQTLLNGFLYRGLYPLINHSLFMDDFVAYLIYYLVRLHKRRITYMDRGPSIDRFVLFLFTSDIQLRFSLLKSIGVERYYLYRYLDFCLTCLTHLAAKLVKINQSFMNKDRSTDDVQQFALACSAYGVVPDKVADMRKLLASNLECYLLYRQNVISHYYKLCYKSARRQLRQKPSSNINIDEIFQNYLIAIAKAIDKYDSRRGAVTSYIKWWILNVNTCDFSNYEYGIAYHIPSSYRRDLALSKTKTGSTANYSNFSVSLDAIVGHSGDNDLLLKDVLLVDTSSDHAENLLAEEESNRFRRLIKAVDPTGVARLYLGVDEVFSAEELALMKAGVQRYYAEQKSF